MILHEYSLDAERARAVDQSCNHPTTMILNQHIALPADRSPAKISQKHAASGGMPCLSLFVCLSLSASLSLSLPLSLLSASLSAGFIYIKERKT